MGPGRLEAFSDGVIAIIITIMVLELKVPEGHELSDLWPIWPKFYSYILSFIYVGIYWNNHHHLMKVVKTVNGAVLWANMHLLFWLSVIPFATAWVGESHFAAAPLAVYGGVMLMSAIAYYILVRALLAAHGTESLLKTAIGRDVKGLISPAIYILAIIASAFAPLVSALLYLAVAIMWLIPDRRISSRLAQ